MKCFDVFIIVLIVTVIFYLFIFIMIILSTFELTHILTNTLNNLFLLPI